MVERRFGHLQSQQEAREAGGSLRVAVARLAGHHGQRPSGPLAAAAALLLLPAANAAAAERLSQGTRLDGVAQRRARAVDGHRCHIAAGDASSPVRRNPSVQITIVP